jgi:purine catabolism regulator
MELTVSDALNLGDLRKARVIAGRAGLSNVIRHVTVIEVPDAHRWLKGHELIITSFYCLKENPEEQIRMLERLKQHNVAALAISYPSLYMKAIPQQLVDKADELHLPLLELPDDVVYINIIEPVLDEIASRHKLGLEYTLHVNRMFIDMLLSGAQIGPIVRALAEELRSPVAVFDRQLTLIYGCIPENTQTDVPGIVTRCMRGNLDDSLIELLSSIQGVQAPTRHVIGANSQEPLNCAVSPIVVNNFNQGFLLSFEINGSFGNTELAVIDQACLGLSLIVVREKAITETELRLQGSLMDELLQGSRFQETLVHRAEQLGLNILSKRLALVVLSGVETGMEEDYYIRRVGSGPWCKSSWDHLYAKLKEDLERENPHNILLLRPKEIVILPELEDPTNKEQAIKKAESIARRVLQTSQSGAQPCQALPFLGIGRWYPDLRDLHLSYFDARKAAMITRCLPLGHNTSKIDQVLCADLVTRRIDSDEARTYVQHVLGPLQDHDSNHNAELVKTLDACFQYNNNTKEALEALHIHRNTLLHRRNTIKRILEFDPFTGYGKLQVDMALLLKRLLDSQLL